MCALSILATFRWRALTYVIHSWPAGQIHGDSGTRLARMYTPSSLRYDGRSFISSARWSDQRDCSIGAITYFSCTDS